MPEIHDAKRVPPPRRLHRVLRDHNMCTSFPVPEALWTVAFFPGVACCPRASKGPCRRPSFRNTERTPEKNRSQGPCRGHRFLLRLPLCWHAVCYLPLAGPRRDPSFPKSLRPGDTRGANPKAKDDEEFDMSHSRNTIVPPEPTKTVQNRSDDSQEQEGRSADPRGKRRRTELDRSRKKEGHEDRHDPGHETDGERPVGTVVSFPEMFFG